MAKSEMPQGVEQATIYERALEMIEDGMIVGLGSGRASTEFIKRLGARFKDGLAVKGVPTSEASDQLARQLGIPLLELGEAIDAGGIDICVDGADECDQNLDLVKGWGRALIREKVVAAASKKFVVLFSDTPKEHKLVPLGTRGKLPVEVAPFARPLCEKKLRELDCEPVLWTKDGQPAFTDNHCYILDCKVKPIKDPHALQAKIQAIPGVLGTGLFLGMANVALVGDENFKLVEEKKRK
jgi:ribose 5-phosphate isomerase A